MSYLIPMLWFLVGTYTIVDKNKIYDVLDVALSAGYRLIGKHIVNIY